MDMNTDATAMVVVAFAARQQGIDDMHRDGALRHSPLGVLRNLNRKVLVVKSLQTGLQRRDGIQ